MRTTLILPEGLIDAARDAAGLSSKTETVVYALKEVVRRRQIADLKGMFGTVDVRLDLDKIRGRRRAPAS
jgi:hypothetical protein